MASFPPLPHELLHARLMARGLDPFGADAQLQADADVDPVLREITDSEGIEDSSADRRPDRMQDDTAGPPRRTDGSEPAPDSPRNQGQSQNEPSGRSHRADGNDHPASSNRGEGNRGEGKPAASGEHPANRANSPAANANPAASQQEALLQQGASRAVADASRPQATLSTPTNPSVLQAGSSASIAASLGRIPGADASVAKPLAGSAAGIDLAMLPPLQRAALLAPRSDPLPGPGGPATPAGTTTASAPTSLPGQNPSQQADAAGQLPPRAFADAQVRADPSPNAVWNVSVASPIVAGSTVAVVAGATQATNPYAPASQRAGSALAPERKRDNAGQEGDAVDGDTEGRSGKGSQHDEGSDHGGRRLTAAADDGESTGPGEPTADNNHAAKSADGQLATSRDETEGPGADALPAMDTPQGSTTITAAAVAWSDRDLGQTLEARWQKWLYWSLTGTAYACLGALAIVLAPRLFVSSAEPLTQGAIALQTLLTVVGSGTALGAWLLSRRMR